MKKLLYIGRPNLGENLFATPCLELLSKDYEIYFLIPYIFFNAFKDYKFIKKLLPSCDTSNIMSKLPLRSLNFIKENLNSDCYFAYHNDNDIAFWFSNPELHFLKPYPILHDNDINKNISRTRKYMQKLQLLSLEQCNDFDCTVRSPEYIQTETINKCVIYQGSRDFLRCLPTQTIQKFIEQIPDSIYLVTKKTALNLNLKERNVEFIITDPYEDSNLEKVIKLFQSKPKVLIGPDAGLTQLATAYKVPLIWLQSRIRLEAVIDYGYKDLCKIYRKKELSCKQDCFGYTADKEYGTEILNYAPFQSKIGYTNFNELYCRQDTFPCCLTYTDEEIKEIVSLTGNNI